MDVTVGVNPYSPLRSYCWGGGCKKTISEKGGCKKTVKKVDVRPVGIVWTKGGCKTAP